MSAMYTHIPANPSKSRHASSPSILMLTPYKQRPCECRCCLSVLHYAASSLPQQQQPPSKSSSSTSSSSITTTFYHPSYTTRRPPLSPVSNYTLLPTPPPEGRAGLSSPPVSPKTLPRENAGWIAAGRRGTFGDARVEVQLRGTEGTVAGKKRSSAEMEEQHRDRDGREEPEERDEWERLEREYVKRVRGWATAVIPVGGK